MGKWIVHSFNTDTHDALNAFLEGEQYHSVYTSPEWLSTLRQVFHYKQYLAFFEEDHAKLAVLPVTLHPKRTGSLVGVSLAQSTHAGVVGAKSLNRSELDSLLGSLSEVGQTLELKSLSLRQPSYGYTRQETKSGDRVIQVLALQNNIEEAWSKLAASRRGRVRKAEKAGVNVCQGLHENLDVFCKFYYRNMRDFGTPGQPKNLFTSALSEFGDRATIQVARIKDVPIGAMFLLRSHNVAHFPWVATDARYSAACPSDSLNWHAIKWAIHNNCRYFDMGRSLFGSGVYQFKANWGCVDVGLDNIRIDQTGIDITAVRDSRLVTGMSELWRRMPVSATIALGPLVRRVFY